MSTTAEDALESKIVAAGLTEAPRIRPLEIDSVIVGKYFFTGANGAANNSINKDCPNIAEDIAKLGKVTFCVLTLKNGSTVAGESYCASSRNYSFEIGCEVAESNARKKVWELEGYLLHQRLSEAHDGYLLHERLGEVQDGQTS